jgi:asparagine synthase (glutamine-hydrolysing)
MCGIAGFVDLTGFQGQAERVLRSMTATIVHRGPDGDGHWLEQSGRVGLGHRRLAIVDLSEAGRQPMISRSGRFVITFNGEVYNFLELRAELTDLGHGFSGHSDTEVMLAAFEQWGVSGATRRFNGMFAFAVWDRDQRCLSIARDRLGKKPLYFAHAGSRLLFGSELKALRVVPGFDRGIDRGALALYLRHNYIPAPSSIYLGVRKLEPGVICTFAVSEHAVTQSARDPYWDGGEVVLAARRSNRDVTAQEAQSQLEALLLDAVRIRMISDVPLGAFLSGGIDSSLVVALMQRLSGKPVRTFTIGFEEEGYNEAVHAAAVARHLGTDHTEVYLTGRDSLDVIPRLPAIFDEPFSDSSQIPTLLVSQIARRDVTVALSGDGGDEGFLGYSRYLWTRDLLGRLRRVPGPVRGALSRGIHAIPSRQWDRMFGMVKHVLPDRLRFSSFGDRLHKLAGVMAINEGRDLYRSFISHWPDPAAVVVDGHEPFSVVDRAVPTATMEEFVEEMARIDLLTYLPDDILVKVDRASMAVSLETRAPLLDYRVIEFGARLPYSLRLQGREGKWILRRLLDRYVPRELTERPKMGFGIPLDGWLRGPLRDWAEALLDENRLRREGYLRPEPIRQLWQEHLNGQRQWQYHIWDILMFQAWLETQ